MDALRRFFRVFDDGVAFKWVVVGLFALEAAIVLLFSLRSAYHLVRMLGDVKFLIGLGAVVLVAAFLLAALLAVAVLGYRGIFESVRRQAERSSLLSLSARALRVNGEAAVFYLAPLAPAGCLAAWLSSGDLVAFLPFPPAFETSGTFVLGLAVLLGGILHAALFVFAAYLAAEVCELLRALGDDVATIRSAKGAKK